jgi:hypothetical protein
MKPQPPHTQADTVLVFENECLGVSIRSHGHFVLGIEVAAINRLRIRDDFLDWPHPAGELALTLEGDEIANLINSKLASHLSASDRLSDASDVQRLIKRLKLPLDYAENLAPEVRDAFIRVWKGEVR